MYAIKERRIVLTFKLVVLFVALLLLSSVIRKRLPVKGLAFIEEHPLCDRMASADVQLLDIRDWVQYEAGHYPNAINIFLGRLPYVNKKELQRSSEIVIISPSKTKIRIAARILRKAGYDRLSGIVWIDKNAERCKDRRKSPTISCTP